MSIEDFARSLSKERELNITVRGRKSGREYSMPVSFVLKGNTIHLLPVKGSSSSWYRNILKDRAMKIAIGGRSLEVKATPLNEPDKVKETLELFKENFGADYLDKWYSGRDVCVRIHLR